VKFLGLTVHEHLSWKPHIESVLHKLRVGYGIVKKSITILKLSRFTIVILFNDTMSFFILHLNLVQWK